MMTMMPASAVRQVGWVLTIIFVSYLGYALLMPWDAFIPPKPPYDWEGFTRAFFNRHLDHDLQMNQLLFIPFGVLFGMVFCDRKHLWVLAIVWWLLGTFISFIAEWLQMGHPNRVGSLTDVVMNSASVVMGLAISVCLRPFGQLYRVYIWPNSTRQLYLALVGLTMVLAILWWPWLPHHWPHRPAELFQISWHQYPAAIILLSLGSIVMWDSLINLNHWTVKILLCVINMVMILPLYEIHPNLLTIPFVLIWLVTSASYALLRVIHDHVSKFNS